nr:replication protein A 70 kDa DNA-binding subunit B-like [Ipomoea batatas]
MSKIHRSPRKQPSGFTGPGIKVEEQPVLESNSPPEKLNDPLIIILHLCTTRMNDDGEVRISSSYIVTKILFNYECPEFPNFKESMPKFLTPIRSISSSSRTTGSRSLEALSSENVTIISLKDIYNKRDGCMPYEIESLIEKTMMFRIVTRKGQFKYSGNVAFTVLCLE